MYCTSSVGQSNRASPTDLGRPIIAGLAIFLGSPKKSHQWTNRHYLNQGMDTAKLIGTKGRAAVAWAKFTKPASWSVDETPDFEAGMCHYELSRH
jgi:hypothetical protein